MEKKLNKQKSAAFFGDEKLEEMLSVINSILTAPPDAEGEGAQAEENGEEEDGDAMEA